jgi:hypothetical protein
MRSFHLVTWSLAGLLVTFFCISARLVCANVVSVASGATGSTLMTSDPLMIGRSGRNNRP